MAQDHFGIVGKAIAGTYLVEQVVAEGGFAVVYRAFHRGFRARVALKCLKIPAELGGTHREQYLKQFRAEAEVLFQLSAVTPTIVRPLHVDSFPGPGGVVPFLALEWLDGWTLDEIIAQRVAQERPAIGLRKLVRMLTPVARALEQAHALPGVRGDLSVVHRDLKPGNLFVAFIGGEQVVKILDFGISKVSGGGRGRQGFGEGGLVSFSPAYGAPEQWLTEGLGPTGVWTDVWGLALTVVEAAKGGPVFTGDPAAMREAIVDPARRPTPRNQGVRVSDEVETVFLRALAVDPKARYRAVRPFWDDLLEALDLDAVGQPKWQRKQDPRVEGARVEAASASMVPRFSGLPPARRLTPLSTWQPSPGLESLEFEPPSRAAEWPTVLAPRVLEGLSPPSEGPGRADVSSALEGPEVPPAVSTPLQLESRDAVPALEVPTAAPIPVECMPPLASEGSSAPDPLQARPRGHASTAPPPEGLPPDDLEDPLDFVDRSSLPPPRHSSLPPAAPAQPSSVPPAGLSAPRDPDFLRSSLPPREAAGLHASTRAPWRSPKHTESGAVRWERLVPAMVLLVLAIVIAVLNQRHGSMSDGESLSWGPLPATWVSMSIFVLAVVLAASSLGRPAR